MFRYSLILLSGLALAGPAAASGADAMFDELSKDFGSVPRGPTLQHAFHITNNTGKVVTIGNVRVSCGCVSASAVKNRLAPGEETAIMAHMDTSRFIGSKSVTIFVRFDEPTREEVRLWVQANARDDVSVAPDTLAFGSIKRGTSSSVSTTVTFLGNKQSQIQSLSCESNYIQPTFKELRRSDSEVAYEVTAKIRSDAPVGKWFTDVWVKTNNPSMAKVRVPLTIEIESPLSVTPTGVNLGQIKTGGQAERKVVVRGIKPFKITAVQGADEELVVHDSTTESKPVHVLTITFKPSKAGDVTRTLRIVTDLTEENEIEFEAKAQVGQ